MVAKGRFGSRFAVNQWLDGLAGAFPDADWTLLSEETAKEQLTEGQPLPAEWLWILDPLDGTKDFLQGTGEYAVHLALVKGQRPVLGVVLLPEADELWIGVVGDDAWCEDRQGQRSPVRFSQRTALSELILVASRSHRDERLEQLIAALQLGGSRAVGSVGCKVATILRGETDLYVSLSGRSAPRTGIWRHQKRFCWPPVVASPTLICRISPTTLEMCVRRVVDREPWKSPRRTRRVCDAGHGNDRSGLSRVISSESDQFRGATGVGTGSISAASPL